MSNAQNIRVYPRYRIPESDNPRYEYEVVGTETIIHPKLHGYNDFSGFIKNVSAEGLCFSSDFFPKEGDVLDMDILLPGTEKIIRMEGEVEWSCPSKIAVQNGVGDNEEAGYRTGLKVLRVDGKPVAESIHFEEKFQIQWSIVLDSIFGTFRLVHQKQ